MWICYGESYFKNGTDFGLCYYVTGNVIRESRVGYEIDFQAKNTCFHILAPGTIVTCNNNSEIKITIMN